MTVKFL